MNTEWSLKEIYTGMDDEAYQADMKQAEQEISKLETLVKNGGNVQDTAFVEQTLLAMEHYKQVIYKLSLYLELRQAVNTEDGEVMAQINRVQRLEAQISPDLAAAQKLLAGLWRISRRWRAGAKWWQPIPSC